MIRWGEREFLFWLAALIPFWIVVRFLMRRREGRLDRLVSRGLWPVLLPERSPRAERTKLRLRLLVLACGLLALARPQWGFKWEEVKQRGLSIVVALDTSKSMLAQDLKPSRLRQATWGIRDLLKRLRGDRIGLVAFAGDAFLQCPATIDYAAFLMMLDDVYVGIAPLGGTDLEAALKTSMEALEKDADPGADKVIILLTDGESHTGNPLSLLPELKRKGIRVFTVGIGTKEGELIQTAKGFVKDAKGNVVKSRLNEGPLRKIAAGTGGFYVRSAPGDIGLERIYEEGLKNLRRTERESRRTKTWTERFQWFLGAGLFLLLIETALPRFRRSSALALVVLLAFGFSPFDARAEETPRSAMRKAIRAYKSGDYSNAVEYLKKTAAEFPGIGNYDLGNALYRSGDYAAAADAFEEALRSTDLTLQQMAYYNLGNALLARTTTLTDPGQIVQASALAFKALDAYEKAILLDPEDLDAKRNFEKAFRLWANLEFNRGKWLYDQADSLLKQFKAKDAKRDLLLAKKQFAHVLADVDPNHAQATAYLKNVEEKLDMLDRAVEAAKFDLETARKQIDDYQYAMAARRLSTQTPERRYAFDLQPELKKKYEELLKKDGDVLKILSRHSDRNLAE